MNLRKTWCGSVAIALFVSCALASAIAHAAPDPEKKAQAKALYERATRLYDVGKYGEAIGDYEEAYLLVEDPALLYNIGQAYRLWDRPEEAIRSYKNYLRKRPDASNRAEVERKIAELERTVEDRRHSSGQPAPVQAQPGQGVPAAGDAYQQPMSGQSEGQAPPQQIGFVPAPSGSEPAGVSQPAAEPPRKRTNWLAYGLIAGGGACLVVAALAAAAGQQNANKLRDASQNQEPFDPTVEKNGKAANALAYVGLAAGVVTGGVGGYLLWRGRSPKSPTTALLPAVAPTYAGASALVSF